MGRAWCGHARPTATASPAKFGAGKFCRFKEQKQIFQMVDFGLKKPVFVVNYQ
jgi:hypothetical protein